jgi:hypothetical protein
VEKYPVTRKTTDVNSNHESNDDLEKHAESMQLSVANTANAHVSSSSGKSKPKNYAEHRKGRAEMDYYYLNNIARPTGAHEVHKATCAYVSLLQSRINLGAFDDCQRAIKKAETIHLIVDGCAHCCPDCHTRYHSNEDFERGGVG